MDSAEKDHAMWLAYDVGVRELESVGRRLVLPLPPTHSQNSCAWDTCAHDSL